MPGRSAKTELAGQAIRHAGLAYTISSWSPVVPKGELQLFLSQYKQPIVGLRDESKHAANNDGAITGA